MSSSTRYRGLDGLRGLAALVVVIHHCFLSVRPFGGPGEASGWQALMTNSPGHLLWAGSEAVLVFFVLSGFVLAMPRATGADEAWQAYYPRRLVRLYLPAVVSLLVALPQARYLRAGGDPARDSTWITRHAEAGTSGFLHDLVLVRGAGWINSPLWSLQWEVIFSLLLPAFLLLLLVRQAGAALLAAAALAGLAAVSPYLGHESLHYLPLFGLGVLACGHRAQVERLVRQHQTAVLVLALVSLSVPWALRGVSVTAVPGQRGVAVAFDVLGASLLVLAFVAGRWAEWAARDVVVQWLGRRSFSLYLVHSPIVVSLAFLLGGHPPLWAMLLIGLPASLLAAEVFGRLVEGPGHRLSRELGRLVLPARVKVG